MDETIKKEAEKTVVYRRFRRDGAVLLAERNAEVKIRDFPFCVLLQGENACIHSNGRESRIKHNEMEIVVRDEIQLAIQEGDELCVGGIHLKIFRKDFFLTADPVMYETSLIPLPIEEKPYEEFPVYKRSPRLIRNIPGEAIELEQIPEKEKRNKGSLIQVILVPLVMLAVTAAVSIIMKRGSFIIMTIVSSVLGIGASVNRFFQDKKEYLEKEEERVRYYEQYLLKMRKKLYQAREKEKEAIAYNYPEIHSIEKMVRGYSSRIYERGYNDDDFLTIHIGYVRERVSYPVKASFREGARESDELEKEAREMVEEFSYIDHKPVVVDLKKAHLGLVGEKEFLHRQLKFIIAQLTCFHSYHDLQIINIYSRSYEEEFAWMRWYPHLRIKAVNVCGNIDSEKMRDQVLGSLNQILKERKIKAEESKKEARFRPHYLFIVDEPKLILDHSIMEYLDKEGDNLGFSIIYTSHLRANLPENMGSVLQLLNSEEGLLILKEKKTVDQKIRLPKTEGVDYERMARDLGVLIHEQGIVSQIPESITFLDMYQVRHPSELNISGRWKHSQSHKSLAVPLGLRAVDDVLYLDLHEKAHGPHGLVAGTTGSGKSEIIQSYILSLAVNFHPYEVGFLLIDYKGGGMAGLFKNLPHLLGTITNLDGSESMRAMASIKSELARRQRIFGENEVNHINSYNRLFREGRVREPLPHLFLISDEFAELKKEQPDFMSELISAARIGRSLGIHLILATQKPSGVVNDQIWTNSRFKLALKVQDESDSKEILKTPDAASITQAGRAYLQVGNNEIYELFQSAWSGAAFSEETAGKEVDDRVYLINELGQGQLVNADLSTGENAGSGRKTQLDVVIEEIQKSYGTSGSIPVQKPWLEPLPGQLTSPLFPGWEDEVENRENETFPCDLSIPVGMVDIPEQQRQCCYTIDLKKDGNIIFYAASGYGKTVFLTTLVLSLALKNGVDQFNVYLCDFGNSALIPLNALPHTADYIVMDDAERLGKMIRILSDEVRKRKKMFAAEMVQNFDVYNQSAENPLKAILVVVDNYDIVKEIGSEAEEFFGKIARDGVSLGIYVVITATRSNAVKYSAVSNYRNKIAGFLFDSTEYGSIVGKSVYKLPEKAGRAYVKQENVNIMQIFSMVPFDNEMEYNANLKKLIAQIGRMFPNKRAPRIPVLPEVFRHTMLKDYDRSGTGPILLGLHKESVTLRGMDSRMSPFLILGDNGKGKSNLLKVILSQIEGRTWVFDSKAGQFYYSRELPQVTYVESGEELEDFIEDIRQECAERKRKFAENQRNGRIAAPREFYASLPVCALIIDDTDDFAEQCSAFAGEIEECLTMAAETGILIVAATQSGRKKGFDEVTKWFKTATAGMLVGSPGMMSVFPNVPARELPVLGEGLFFSQGGCERLMLPRYEEK